MKHCNEFVCDNFFCVHVCIHVGADVFAQRKDSCKASQQIVEVRGNMMGWDPIHCQHR